MEEKERKEKLKAGKEKLAQFQKKKKKKKQKSDANVEVFSRDSDFTVGGEVLGYSTQSGAEFIYDSDNQSVSSCSEEEPEGNEDPTSKQVLRIRSELQQKSDRVEELEELLVGKQLALDKVLKENAELQKQSSTNLGNQPSVEDAKGKISEDGDHHDIKNKDVEGEGDLGVVKFPEFDPTEVWDLVQQVQWLQLQLKQTGSTLRTQNEKQTQTVNALQKAKSEILDLQENIIQKDNVVKELAKNLKIISNECKELKESKKNQTDADQNKEKTLCDDIVRLQHDKEAIEIKLKELEQDLTLSSKEKQDLKKLNESLGNKLESIEKFNESIVSNLEKRILTLEEENKSLHGDKESLVHFESKLKSEINVLNEKIDQFENMKKDFEQRHENAMSDNERLLSDNNALREEVVNLKEDNSMYQTQISNYENKITQAEESIEENLSLRIQNDDLNNKINNQKDVIASLRSSTTALTTENVKLMEQLENISSSVSLQNVEMEAVKSERDNLLLLSEERGQVLHELQTENDHYKALNISLEDEISALKLKLSTAQLENDTLLQEKMAFQKEMHKQKKQVDKETVIVPEEILPQVEEVYHAQRVSKHYAVPNVEERVHEHVNSQIVENVIPLPDVPKIEPDYPTGANVHELSNLDNVLILNPSYARHDPDTSSEQTSLDKDTDSELQIEQLDNDTAYQSQSFCGGFDNGNMEYPESLKQKTDECEKLKAVIQNLQTQIRRLTLDQPDSVDMFSVSNPIDYGQDVKESSQSNQEVSQLNVCRIDASEMEVNLHASSYPRTTQWDDPCLPSSVQSLGFDHVAFQQREPVVGSSSQEEGKSQFNEQSSNTEETSRLQKETNYLNEIVNQIQVEKTDFIELYEQAKLDKEHVSDELDKLSKSYSKLREQYDDLNNLSSKLQSELSELHSINDTLKNKNEDLAVKNEKIIWERDELQIRLNTLDSEFLTMKTVKCDLEYKEEQVREELIQVKERLEYLESCDKDIFEMKEIVEKLQEDKEIMLKENEALQCSLASKVDENDRVCKHMDIIVKENTTLKFQNEGLHQEIDKLNSGFVALKCDLENIKKDFENISEIKDSQEIRFHGEIEGLENENSTLKTKVKSYEVEIELQKSEMERLGNFFSNIDNQIEEIGMLKHRNSEIETKLEEVSKENEDLVHELLNCQKKIDDLQYDRDELCSKSGELQNIIDEMDNEKTCLLEIVENLKCELDNKVKNKDCIIEKYEMQLDGLDNENATLKTQVSSLKQDLQEVLQQSQVLDEEHVQQSEKISLLKSEKEILKGEAKTTQSKVTQLEEDMLELVNQVQLYDTTLTEKMDLASRLDLQVKELLDENSELRERCDSFEHDIDELKTKESYLTEQLKIYEENIASNQNKSDELSRVQSQLELEIKYKLKAQEDTEKTYKEVNKLSKENEQLQSELQSVRKDFEELIVARDHDSSTFNLMRAKIENAETERDEILLEHQSVCNNVSEVVDENELLRREIDNLNMNLNAISENRNHIRNQVEVLSAEIESLANERDTLTSENKRLVNEVEVLKLSEQNVKDNFIQLSEKFQSLFKHSEETDSQNEKLQDQNDKIRLQTIQFQDKLTELEEAMKNNAQTQGENKALSKKLEDLKHCVDNLQVEKQELETVIEDLTNMLHDMQIKYEEVKSEMESTKKKCDKEIGQLQSHLQVMNDDVTELRKVLDVMESEMYNVNEEKQVLKENFEQQKAELLEAVEAKELLLERLSDKEQKDLKNMKMVDKLNQEKQEISHLSQNSSDDMNSLDVNVTSNHEQHLEIQSNENEINVSEDQLVPSFENVLQFFPYSDHSTVSCHVQTNISIGEFEKTGLLLDDNGECSEIVKDYLASVYTQTDSSFGECETFSSDLSCHNLSNQPTETHDFIATSTEICNQSTQAEIQCDDSVKMDLMTSSVSCQCDIIKLSVISLEQLDFTDSAEGGITKNVMAVDYSAEDTQSIASEVSGIVPKCDEQQNQIILPVIELVNTDISCQTDIDFHDQFDLEVQLQLKVMENDLDNREKNIKKLEDNYDKKVNQAEYELEEKYEQRFRDMVAEISVKAEKDKKKHASEVETEAKRQIEKVKVEKDQQFVVALQQVRADLSTKKKSRKTSTRRAMPHGSPSDTDAAALGSSIAEGQLHKEDVHQLRQDNEELAQARDDLLQKINLTQLEQEVFRDELYNIMGEHNLLGDQQLSPSQQAVQMTPSLLDWELSPELSFDSVRSSLDTKSLSGSLDPSSFCSNTDCLSVRMKYENLIEKIQQFLKIKSDQDQAKSPSKGDLYTVDTKNTHINVEGNENMFIENSDPDDQILQRVTSIHLEHWAKNTHKQDETDTSVKDTFVEESNQQDEAIMDNIIQEIVTESQVQPLSSADFLETPVYHSKTSRKRNRKRFALTFFSTPSDSDKSPEGIKDVNVSPFSHCTSSVSTMEEGHFSEDEHDGLSYASSAKKRHYSDGDIQQDEDRNIIKTSQSDNFEGHFVSEKANDLQTPRADSLPPETKGKSSNEDVTDNVFVDKSNFKTSESGFQKNEWKNKDSKQKKVSIDEENVFVAENSNDVKVHSISMIQMLESNTMSGKDSGDFFEESFTANNDDERNDERIDSGDILEKLGNEIAINEKGDNSMHNVYNEDGIFQGDIASNQEADFIKEAVSVTTNEDSNCDKEEIRTNEFENARFDVLNAICPGTNPLRNPEFRNDKRSNEKRKIKEKESTNDTDLQKKVDDLEGVILILESQKKEANETIDYLTRKLDEISSNDSMNTYIQELEQKLKVLKNRQAELVPSTEMSEEKAKDDDCLTEFLIEMEQELAEKDEELLDARYELSNVKERNTELEEMARDQMKLKHEIYQLTEFKENIVHELEKEKFIKISLEKEKTAIEDTLINQADVYDELKEKYLMLQTELAKTSDAKSLEIQQLHDKCLELTTNLQKENNHLIILNKNVKDMQKENENLKLEKENLKKDILKQHVHQETSMGIMTKTIDELKQAISVLEETEKAANKEINDRELKLKCVLSEKEILLSDMEKLHTEVQGLKVKVSNQEEMIHYFENRNILLRKDFERHDTVLRKEIIELKEQQNSDNQINKEHEWAIKELASQLEILEKEKQSYCDTIKDLEYKLSEQDNTDIVKVKNKELQALRADYDALKERMDNSDTKSDCSNTDQQILEDLKETLKLLQDEKISMEKQYKEDKAILIQENTSLSEDYKKLFEEKAILEKTYKSQEDNLKKENSDILKMYSDLRNEVEVLVISKHDLEIELVALKNLLEHGDPSLVKLPQESGRELTLQDLEDLDELKTSIEQLKSEMKEKDDYVRKLEEHLLGAERGLPSLTSTPKPFTSKGEPAMSKTYRQRKLLQIGKRAFSHDLPIMSVQEETSELIQTSQHEDSGQDNSLHSSDLEQSNISEKQFTQRLVLKDSAFTSSQQSDKQSVMSSCGSLDSSKIRSGLKPEEDGHLALELKQFELVDEISSLKRDFRETKALYAQETALLTEALEKEKAYKEYLDSGRGRTASDPSGKQNFVVDFPKDLVRLRQDVAVLKEENKLLKIENERWIRKIKEQEKIVFDLKDRLVRNTSGIEEIEEVFGRQLALLQKQREELLDKLKDREDENNKLSVMVGEKGILEESLRREKDILLSKLREKTAVENELQEKQQTLVVLQSKHKEMEDIIYQKDLNERELMKQKRLLEEELHEIEAKFRDREENLGYEKNQLLDELRKKRESKSSVSDSDVDDTRSVCSDSSSFSDRHIANLEFTLADVEKQHAEAVRLLREQLKSKYSRREKALRRDHRTNLEKLQNSAREQVT